MVTYRGHKTHVSYISETAYGTGSAPDKAINGKIQTITINKNNNTNRIRGLGNGRNENVSLYGNFSGSFSLEYDLAAFDFLQYAFGSKTGAGNAGSPYCIEEKDLMDYTATDAYGIKSFTLYASSLGATNDVERLTGCIINTVGLTFNLGETLKCSLDGFFKKPDNSATSVEVTPTSTKPWIFAQGIVKKGTTTLARITSVTINVANGFTEDDGRQIGSRFVEAAEPGIRTYDGVLVAKMTTQIATELRDEFYGATDQPTDGVANAELNLFDLSLTLSEGSTAGKRNAIIQLADCSIKDISKPINIGDAVVEVTINFSSKKAKDGKIIKWWTVE